VSALPGRFISLLVPLALRVANALDACSASFSFQAGSSDAIRLGLRLMRHKNGESGWHVHLRCDFIVFPKSW
tara:strand:- start:2911 stop:3126 length:216 start_codon:yes stop_codon:yes gene_type:complete